MAWYRCGGGGVPASLKHDMNVVLNKKFNSLDDYDPKEWPELTNLLGKLPEETVSGSIVTFSDGADDVPIKSCEVALSASLDGYSSVDVVQAGRNLFNGTLSSSGASYIECYGNIHNPAYVTTGLRVKAGVTYTISFVLPSALTNGIYGAYVSNKTLITLKTNSSTANPTATFTAPQDDELCFWLYFSGGSTAPDVSLVTCQVEFGSTAHDYEPYTTPTTYTASLGRTIYGGQVDIVNGDGTDENGNDFTFEPVEINSRLGANTMWSEQGDTEVTYRRDIDLALGGQ